MKWLEQILGWFKGGATNLQGSRPVAWSSMASLLEDLEQFGKEHEELYDTDVRERLWGVANSALIQQTDGYIIPKDLGMFSPEANAELVSILKRNVKQLREAFSVFKLDTEQKRLTSFFNPKLHTESGSTVDDFFGHP